MKQYSSNLKRYSLEEVLEDSPNYNLSLLKEESEKRGCSGNGGNFKFNAIKVVATILEAILKKLNKIENKIMELQEQISEKK